MTSKQFIYIITLGHTSVDWCQSAIPALLPYFIANYGLSYKEAAALVFASVMVSSLVQPVFGYYADRASRPWMMALGPVACGVGVSTLGLVSSYPIMFAAALLSGLGSSLYHPEAAMLSGKLAGRQQGRAMSTFGVGGNAGFAIGPLIAGFCAYTIDIRTLALFGALNLAMAAWLLRILPAALEMAGVGQPKAGGKSAAGAVNDWHSFARLSIVVVARSMAFTLTNTFLPIFLIAAFAASAQFGANVLTALFTAGVAITMWGGTLADRVGYVKVIRVAFLVMVPTMFALPRSGSLGVALALLLPAAVAIFLGYSPIIVLGQKYLAKNAGFASGVTLGLGTTIGGMLAPAVGWVADTWGLMTALQVLWVAGVMGCAGAFALKDS